MQYHEAIRFLNLEIPVHRDSVKLAYRKLARQYHPDAGGTDQQFRQLQKAYEVAMQGLRFGGYHKEGGYAASTTEGAYTHYRTTGTDYGYAIYIGLAAIALGLFVLFDFHLMFQNLLNHITCFHIAIAFLVGFVAINIYRNPANLFLYVALAIFAIIAWQEITPYYWQITNMFSQFDSTFSQINNAF